MAAFVPGLLVAPAHAAGCTPVTISNGQPATAAAVNAYTGEIDGSGCVIGDYISVAPSSPMTVTVHDSTNVGIFVDGGAVSGPVDITGATIYNIGNHDSEGNFAPDGGVYGTGIFFCGGSTEYVQYLPCGDGETDLTGTVSDSTIYNYQAAGIVVNHHADVNIVDNTITGIGRSDIQVQVGVQLAWGGTAELTGNTISYNGPFTSVFHIPDPTLPKVFKSTGVLVLQTAKLSTAQVIADNILFRNQSPMFYSA